MNDASTRTGDMLMYRLLSGMAGAIYASEPDPLDRRPPSNEEVWRQLMENLRGAFSQHRAEVDVSSDVALGRAIETLAIGFRDQEQPDGWHGSTENGRSGEPT